MSMVQIFLILPFMIFGVQGQQGFQAVAGSDICNISCICEDGETLEYKPLEFKSSDVDDSDNGTMKCSSDDINQACGSRCFVKNIARFWDNKTDFISSIYPQVFTVLRGEFSDRRFAREVAPCRVLPMKTAEMTCYVWPNYLNCDVNCVPFHAINSSGKVAKSTNIRCSVIDDEWKPHGFEECTPYVNCNVHLSSAGRLECNRPTNKPPFCDITCNDYDGFETVHNKRVTCVDEKFAASLPRCADLTEVELIKKPE